MIRRQDLNNFFSFHNVAIAWCVGVFVVFDNFNTKFVPLPDSLKGEKCSTLIPHQNDKWWKIEQISLSHNFPFLVAWWYHKRCSVWSSLVGIDRHWIDCHYPPHSLSRRRIFYILIVKCICQNCKYICSNSKMHLHTFWNVFEIQG